MRNVVVVAAAVVLCSCATVEGGQRAAANVLLPPADEIAIGKKMKRELDKQVKMHPSPEVQAYVERIGRSMARRIRSPVPLHFHVIDDDKQVNAFAIPGGDIYIYSGMLKLANDDAELACVLSHEISHVTRRHVAQKLVQQVGLQTLLGLALGDDPGILVGLAAQVAGTGTLLKFSRDHERDADEYGLPLCSAAGYDPNGFVRMFQKIKKMGEASGAAAFLQSHPVPSERIDDAKQRIIAMKAKGTATNERRYSQFKAQLNDRSARNIDPAEAPDLVVGAAN
ncbi:MAG: M48 family metallopeptidase [Deltaproteobacteria bacterium]|nr:M48 family metallopeptidase [Deltaproteobacteria bacterium]